MVWLMRISCLVGAHDYTYRERRSGILHFICSRCGQAIEAVGRTPDEHERVIRIGRVRHPVARVRPAPSPPSASERARARQVLGL